MPGIAEGPWILSPEPCDARRILVSRAAALGKKPRIVAEVQDTALQLSLVAAGLGFGIVPVRSTSTLPLGISVVAGGFNGLTLRVLARRSPHLNGLNAVVDVVASAIRDTATRRQRP